MKLPKRIYDSIAVWLADKDDPSLLKSDGYSDQEVTDHLIGQAEHIMSQLYDWQHQEEDLTKEMTKVFGDPNPEQA